MEKNNSKDLRRLTRRELLELLVEQGQELERIRDERDRLKTELENREIKIANAGSIAEAALSLGMTETRTFYRVVFPQAFRYVIPSLIAELVIVLKDTTFAYIVTCADLMQNAKVLISNYDAMLSVYLVVAVIYILINWLLNRLSDRMAAGSGRTGAGRSAV